MMQKTAIVTGASSGIGMATVEGLVAAGYAVFAGARRVDRMKPLEVAGARLLSLDVTDDTSMTTAVDTIARETGRIDLLVNNAGYGSYGALEDVPLAEGRRQFEVYIWPGAPDAIGAADHAGTTLGSDHQYFFDWGQAR